VAADGGLGGSEPPAPTVLAGRYEVGPLLGRGGMAEVRAGRDRRLGRPVAIKLLRVELARDPGARRRFEAEAQAAARLVHPHVVAVFDTGEDGERPWIVMERLPGRSLADRFAEGPLALAEAERLSREVLGALAVAHASGIVHRDVKPSNILYTTDGSVKVADFGIAKTLDEEADATATNVILGTPAYVAPERLDGRPATPASDLFSFGVVLFEGLSGRRPFERTKGVGRLVRVTPPLATLRPDLPVAAAAAIEATLAEDPAQRPQRALELAEALGIEPVAVPPSAGGSRATRRTSSGATWATGGTTAVVGPEGIGGRGAPRRPVIAVARENATTRAPFPADSSAGGRQSSSPSAGGGWQGGRRGRRGVVAVVALLAVLLGVWLLASNSRPPASAGGTRSGRGSSGNPTGTTRASGSGTGGSTRSGAAPTSSAASSTTSTASTTTTTTTTTTTPTSTTVTTVPTTTAPVPTTASPPGHGPGGGGPPGHGGPGG